MLAEEILKLGNNVVIEGNFIISDIKLKPFTEKEGHFLTFNLQDKSGMLWSKIWDDAEAIAIKLKGIQIVTIKGRTNIYNKKTQIIVEKIKEAEVDSYDISDLVKVSSRGPEEMWEELLKILEDNFSISDYKRIWSIFLSDEEFVKKFKLWPGGKGTVHHAYQHGLLEHTLSVVKMAVLFSNDLGFDLDKALLGAVLHDIGKIEAYQYNMIKIEMSNIGRLQEHTVLGYYTFRKIVEESLISSSIKSIIIEDIGHIILSHHGSKEFRAVVKPMTIEAKIVSIADLLDANTNYMLKQLEHNADDKGWLFDSLNSQFFFKRPVFKRRKLIKDV